MASPQTTYVNIMIGTPTNRALQYLALLLLIPNAHAQNWQPLTGADVIAALFSDTTMTATLKDGVEARATYNADGTGELNAWGGTFLRRWEIRGDDQVCLEIDQQTRCFRIEKDTSGSNNYRATAVDTGETVVFSVAGPEIAVGHPGSGGEGGAAAPSAEEVAAQLANPNSPLATLTFRLQYRDFKGSLPNANNQGGTTLLAQPSFPFARDNGDVIFFRPAIPLQMGFPTFNAASGQFETEFGLGDIAFDLAYGRTSKSGIAYAGGVVSSLPTATGNLGSDNWTLGPEALVAKISKNYVIGTLLSHQWDVAGSGSPTSLSTAQIIYTYLPGGGWNVGTTPIVTYDHEGDQWTIPLNFTLGKTVIVGGRPWKLGIELNYYVDQSDAFGPDWFIGVNAGPVVENVLARWFD